MSGHFGMSGHKGSGYAIRDDDRADDYGVHIARALSIIVHTEYDEKDRAAALSFCFYESSWRL